MTFQYSLFLILAPLAAALAVGVLHYARRYRASAGAETSALAWLVGAVVGWLVLNTAELLAPSPAPTLFWAQASYLFIAATPVAWLGFALQYSGRTAWRAPRRFAWLCVVPAATAVLAITNPWHGWLWRQYEFVQVGNLVAMRVVAYGPGFWVYAIYAHLVVLLGAVLVGRQYFRSFDLYRRQSAWVVAGALIPVAANLIYLFHLVPGLTKDYTAISFALASVAFMVGMSRYQLFDLKPVAREVVIDDMSDAMLTVDARGRIVDLNPAAARLVAALHGDDLGGRSVGRLASRVLAPWPALVEHLAAGGPVEADVSADLDGRQHHYDLQVSPLAGRGEDAAGRLVVLRDITARKEAEEQLRAYALELEAHNEELDAFARTVAHDLKDPLGVLVSAAEYLGSRLDRISPAEQEELVAAMVDTGRSMATIVDELLLLARVHRSTGIPVEALDLAEIVLRVQMRLENEIARTGARLVVPEDWPRVVGYAPWVEEVWANYVSNALRYGGRPEEGAPPCVELGYDEPVEAGAGVRFWVRDEGPGLSVAEQARLFVEFTRLDRSRAAGNGLGLAIVQRIVQRLGGKVGVESEEGQGSTFWFTLPRP
jgi:PAS domain S-box-containing protein